MKLTKSLQAQVRRPPSVASFSQLKQSLHNDSDGLDYSTFGRLLQICADRRLLRYGKHLHARLVLSSVSPDNFLASKLVTFYSKTSRTYQARKVFDEIPQKNTFAYNAMLIAYSSHEKSTETLTLFSSFLSSSDGTFKPDHITVTSVLKALSSSSSSYPNLSREIHGYVLIHGFDSDLFVTNALITYYSRCDKMDSARKVFDSMRERDIVSWNALLAGYSQGGYYEECLRLYRHMLDVGNLKPNGMTLISVLQSCAQLKDLVLGMEVHKYVVESEVETDVALCNSIIGLYAKCGSLDYARELFEEMSEKDEITYGSLISGYMINGCVDEAIELFRCMKSQRLSTWNAMIAGLGQNNRHENALEFLKEMLECGFKPNSVTLSSILPSISYFSNLRGGKEIHAYAIKNRQNQNVYVVTALIDNYAKAGYLGGARHVFDQYRDRTSVIIWTAIIAAYASHGNASEALILFKDMLKFGTDPDPITFTAVLSACAHSGADEAWEIFHDMFPKYGVRPTVEHYACMIGVLSRAGKLSEAAYFISKMPIEPNSKAWGALLNGASVFGDVEIGKFAWDHLFEAEPENTGSYLIMANLYSRAGRWEEAERTRERMRSVGLKKVPGNSWIETSEGLQWFICKDTSNTRSREVYDVLNGLLWLMRDEGYICRDELDEEYAYS